jgi:hypothetical protein
VTFLSKLALAVALLVIAPYVAHRLRRRRGEQQPFPPARLVHAAPPQARRRSRLEDRALLVIRAVSIVVLAALGATPFVRCSRLSLQRSVGASVAMALVVDDSMSMRVSTGGRSRFERALQGARELLASAREGDAVAVVLAGAPARVGLAATTDLSAARKSIEGLSPSDRATDLEGALVIARGLIESLPQVERGVVLLSDLADGRADGPPLGESAGIPIWVALPEMRVDAPDCGVVRADQRGAKVHAAIVCGPGKNASDREVVAEGAKGETLSRASPPAGSAIDVTLLLPADDARAERVRLSGADAIAADDVAPVLHEQRREAIAVVASTDDEATAAGGVPVVERALGALKLDESATPIPAVPERRDELVGISGLVLDDPPGFTPEQRHAIAGFVADGGLILLALGPRASAPPLGATLEPLLTRTTAWSENTERGADAARAIGPLAGSAASLADLGAARRTVLSTEDAAAFETLVRWTDGAPLIARRAVGRGEVWIVTLPFSVDSSDLALRPSFLALLSEWVQQLRERAAPLRSDPGADWAFPGASRVQVDGPGGRLEAIHEGAVLHVVAPLLGAYRLLVDGQAETRVIQPDRREMDLRPRAIAAKVGGEGFGQRRAYVDASAPVALLLLALMTIEIALRMGSRGRPEVA